MRNCMAIFRKELRIAFTTPLAYVAWTVFLLIAGLLFTQRLSEFQALIQRATHSQPDLLRYLNFTDQVLRPLFVQAATLFALVVPLLTMRTIAEERRTKTFEWLQACPVKPLEIVLGKYLACFLVIAAMVLFMVLYPLIVWAYAEYGGPSWGTVMASLIGLLLAAAAFTAIGLFVSSLTDSQFVAGVITFFILLFLLIVGRTAEGGGLSREVLGAMNVLAHLEGFSAGRIDFRDVVYFLSLAGLGLFAARLNLETQRWR